MCMSTHVFIVGMPTSGTTLMYRLLDGCDNVLALPGETHYFKRLKFRKKIYDTQQSFLNLVGKAWDYERKKKMQPGTYIERDKNWISYNFWETIMELSDNIRQDEKYLYNAIEKQKTDRDVFNALIEVYKKHAWKKDKEPEYIIEKTPGNEWYLEKIIHLFPDAKIIHMVRNPFDWISAMNEQFQDIDKSAQIKQVLRKLRRWKISLLQGMRFKKKYPDQHRFVVFENLVQKTEPTMRAIAHYLSMEFSDTLLTPTADLGEKQWKGHTSQNIDIKPGAIDTRVLDKDATKIIEEDILQIIGSYIPIEYDHIGWNKYKKYTSLNKYKIFHTFYQGEDWKDIYFNRRYYFEILLSKINTVEFI